jgi:hypothetical protein
VLGVESSLDRQVERDPLSTDRHQWHLDHRANRLLRSLAPRLRAYGSRHDSAPYQPPYQPPAYPHKSGIANHSQTSIDNPSTVA